MGAGPDNKPLASPGNFFPSRKRRVAEPFAELLGRSFLPFPHFAAVDHHIMRIALSLHLDLAKFDQSRFHISMFRWLDLEGKRQGFRVGLSSLLYARAWSCSINFRLPIGHGDFVRRR
jgi:hypothetical protein